MPVERILFPTKFRELSFNSLEQLFVLKQAGLKEIILCHVISRESVGFVPFGGYMKDEEERLREEATVRFEDWRTSIAEKGMDSKIVIRVGEPVPQILHAAEDEKADMIVVGKKKKALELPFAGSNTLEIASRSSVPVLVSKYMVHYEIEGEQHERVNERIFERPMLVTDWSEPSLRAVDFLKSLHPVIEEALVFHDIDVEKVHKKHTQDLAGLKKVTIEKLGAVCDELKGEGAACETHLGAGDVLSEILRVSRDRQASMIIVGTTGKGRLSEFIHGSVSHEVVKASELPCLLVP
ncbi:MAG: universal stress protein [Nitrospiraceae bacterium]|nr:MAG: universal stress protein [Nitrospiraceae bacterium]